LPPTSNPTVITPRPGLAAHAAVAAAAAHDKAAPSTKSSTLIPDALPVKLRGEVISRASYRVRMPCLPRGNGRPAVTHGRLGLTLFPAIRFLPAAYPAELLQFLDNFADKPT